VLLALKLLLVPALLAAISMAGKRWGPGVAGWLAGFPSLTGPILFFLAIERGPEFTVQAAVLSLSAVFPAIAFGVTYAWVCTRLRWQGSIVCAFSAWAAAVLLFAQLPLTVWGSLAISLLTLFAAPRLFPRAQTPWGSRPLPAYALLRAMIGGFYAYIAYCLAVALLLEPSGIAVTYSAAVVAAITVQGAAKLVMMRLAR
jgi:uncharacterized membrane protein (GlpM family)